MAATNTVDGNVNRTSLVFSVRGPIPIHLDEHGSSSSSSSSPWSSGASVLDLVFPQPESVSEITFRNWYTARLTLLVRFDDSVQAAPKREHLAWAAAASLSLARLRGVDSTEGIKIGRNLTNSKSLADWVVSIQNRQLMPDPHSELGSQDLVTVAASESLVPLHDITALRFLLRQPSPNWKTFGIEDIAVYRHPLKSSSLLSAPNPSANPASSPSTETYYGRRSPRSSRRRSSILIEEASLETMAKLVLLLLLLLLSILIEEASLETMAKTTKEAITGRKEEDANSNNDPSKIVSSATTKSGDDDLLLPPTTYDVMSLQI